MQVQFLGQEDPLEKETQPTPVFLLENPMDTGAQRAMPTKEWVMTEHTH